MPAKKKTTKRRDSFGRVLRTGESQRKDGTYEYRYTDKDHKRRSIYAMTLEELRSKVDELNACKTMGMEECTRLEELRKKEAEALICAAMGIDLSKGDITVNELVERYVNQKRNVRYTTRSGYRFVQSVLRKYDFGKKIIRDVKVADVKDWLITLFDDGYAGFILLDQNHQPKVGPHIEHVMQRICEKYNGEHVIPLPKISPHVFRHTFCTNMANAGMDVKSLQYLMGHSDVSVTLNVYTHTEYGKAQTEMAKICSFTDIQMPTAKPKLRKLG